MVGQTRSKLKGAAPEPRQSSRSMQSKRRRRPTGAGEPEMEEESQKEVEKPELLQQPAPVGGGNLPGGARDYSPRRIRNLHGQNCLHLEVVSRNLFLGRFQFLHFLLQRLREKVHVLQTRRFSSRSIFGMAAFVGILHWIHLITLFENDRHFSHLSSLEREMTFRTEMGLYYSYFKTIIEAPSFLEGLWMIMNDRLTEYPLVINTVKRFHLYPEVIIACWYRTFMGIMNLFGLETKTCWNVTRIEPLNEVQSCEGLGDPACFYVGVIFILNGLMMGLFFIYGAYLSGTQLGGLITVLCYFFNHGEATRVMWTPPLRESFSYPFLVLQMYVLTLILREMTQDIQSEEEVDGAIMPPPRFQHCAWTPRPQTPPPPLGPQNCPEIASLFPMYIVGYIEPSKFQKIIYMNMLIQGSAWWCGTIILKFLTSKVLGVSDHTPLRYTKTLLLPVVMVITCFIFKKTVRDILCVLSTNTYLRKQLLEHGELVFHTLQLLAFTALAILIMRLKLFLTPHMCIMASLMCSRRLFGWLFCRVRFENVIFGILTVMSVQGCANLHNQWSIIGEFNNLPQEELIQWIRQNTRPDAVFAGAMPTMASVKLSTLHPIVNHPHYEDADLRARTKIVYSAYSRKSPKEVRDKLLELHVHYYVLEEAWCVVRTK
ncbi:PREDICTED: probable C-mannosyltransferase DPY19L2 [Propithecus coquereli]|uniref:probable C-mannosyltransferase DPY19L2 n=1 Tax=Propithecus coquereli TaxID=379532 RepID=UPI00063FCFEF|nr:PREDICTED: probable C-mannosyltransferase DPY19L2 [Propithecus coquereli]